MGSGRRIGVLLLHSRESQARFYRDYLHRYDVDVEVALDCEATCRRLRERAFDIALLDRQAVPGSLQLARSVRVADPRIGIVMMDLNWDPLERLLALEETCDDCVSTAGDLTELVARLRAVARRVSAHPGNHDLRWGPFQVDLLRGRAIAGNDEVSLQPLQLRTLAFFVNNAERVITQEELRSELFRVAQAKHSSSVARQVCLLRARLGPFRALIATVRGGYYLGEPRARSLGQPLPPG